MYKIIHLISWNTYYVGEFSDCLKFKYKHKNHYWLNLEPFYENEVQLKLQLDYNGVLS